VGEGDAKQDAATLTRVSEAFEALDVNADTRLTV
jgi:hypothetical protein